VGSVTVRARFGAARGTRADAPPPSATSRARAKSSHDRPAPLGGIITRPDHRGLPGETLEVIPGSDFGETSLY